MNCDKCGAPLTPVRERGHLVCEYCKSYRFPEKSPDGVKILGPADEEVRCPVCTVRLLVASFYDRYEGWVCGQCKGMLLDRDTFVEMVGWRRAWATGAPDPEGVIDQGDLAHQARCPLCQQMMDTHPYLGPGAFVIDSCVPCNVLWLDHGEIELATNAPGRHRGSAYRTETAVPGGEPDWEGSGKVRIELELTGLLNALFSHRYGDWEG